MKIRTRELTAARLLAKLINNKTDQDGAIVLEDEDRVLVSWEEGPFEWAVALTGGSSIFAGEFGDYHQDNPWYDEVKEIAARYHVMFECKNSFQITVWED